MIHYQDQVRNLALATDCKSIEEYAAAINEGMGIELDIDTVNMAMVRRL